MDLDTWDLEVSDQEACDAFLLKAVSNQFDSSVPRTQGIVGNRAEGVPWGQKRLDHQGKILNSGALLDPTEDVTQMVSAPG